MAIAVKIDFDDVYEIDPESEEMTSATFSTILTDGTITPLWIEIQPPSDLLPKVYNLAFGPHDKKGELDDSAELTHQNYSKVFSTILLHAKAYLTLYPDHYLGIDGSNNARAFLYYRQMLRNFAYLDEHFNMGALKYYVRITRFGKTHYENPFDFTDILPEVVKITKDSPKRVDHMYNYFIFNNKDKN
ncbi:hypothetical protein SAMN05421788_103514 [Filimonas lacunae]|uniref:Uncharacterized protein n=1 Tax=Filimonas lacunae TaxID=477680 RepID=A0A173ML23_9BACT|nr:hypothetical protein [Filimonas lacunae]BAV08177.1 hypothetical protein FLA_4210 [Filimonas lacunae]SIT10432.1 hypothetical protein SAMN05421788_103514 [Filimonas lacunae]